MTLLFEYETEYTFPFDMEAAAKEVIAEALRQEGVDDACEISLTFTDDAGIMELNASFRDIHKPTDVLSFPMIDYDGRYAGEYEFLEQDKNPDTGDVLLGDIVLSLERVAAQASEYGHSPKREFAFLIAHSMLHLFGYDHMSDDERELMEEKQERILSALSITR